MFAFQTCVCFAFLGFSCLRFRFSAFLHFRRCSETYGFSHFNNACFCLHLFDFSCLRFRFSAFLHFRRCSQTFVDFSQCLIVFRNGFVDFRKYAFLHFCISALLHCGISAFLHCYFLSLCMDLSESVGVNRL